MKRNNGLDLLRMLAGMAVVMLHFNFGYAFKSFDVIPYENQCLLYSMEALSLPAVNIFLLISGYFLYNSAKRQIGKILYLLVFAVLVNELYYITVHVGRYPIVFKELIQGLIPRYYFIILYIGVYFLSPYINLVLRNISVEETKRLLLSLIVILSVEPWLIDIFEMTTPLNWKGMSMISFWGGGSGQTLVHFLFMYVVGASLNKIMIARNRIVGGGIFSRRSSSLSYTCLI